MGEERSISLSFLIHASPGHAPCPAARSASSFSFYPALPIPPLPEDCRPTCNPLPPREGPCCRGPLSWVQSPRQILALSLTKCRSLWVDYCGSVALCCSGLVALDWYLVAAGWSCVFIGYCGLVAVGCCGSVIVGQSLCVSRCGSLWDGRCCGSVSGSVTVGRLLRVGRCRSL